MSLAVAALVVGGIIGCVVGFILGADVQSRSEEEVMFEALEEGFRTFIEHHTEVGRDSEEADRAWAQTVSQKQTEMALKEYARR